MNKFLDIDWEMTFGHCNEYIDSMWNIFKEQDL